MNSCALPAIRSPRKAPTLKTSPDSRKGPSQTDSKIQKTKKIYLAKKANNDDLYGNAPIHKQSGLLELSQIKEERGVDLESVSQTDSRDSPIVHFLDVNNKETKNVFQLEKLSSPKYKEHNMGPLYKNGKLIKHSIIGSPDNFEKYKKTLNRFNTRGNLATESNMDLSSSKLVRGASLLALNDDSSFVGRIPTSSSNLARRISVRGSIIKENKKEIKISKEELLDRIDEMYRDQEEFYNTQSQEYFALPLTERLQQTKDERRLDKFHETVNSWEKSAFSISNKIGRNPENSVMRRGKIFREKKELADLIETAKTDDEKLGDHFWEITLRKYGEDFEKGNHCSVTKDLPEGFSSVQFNKSRPSFQVIRKTIEQNGILNKHSDHSKLLDRTCKEYLQKKISKLGKFLKKIDIPDSNQVESLMIKGKNKLDMEATAVLTSDDKREAFYFPKTFGNSKIHENINQVIEESYEKTIPQNVFSAFL